MAARREITVLGPVGIHLDGEPIELGPSLRRLLAALVVARGATVSVSRLADIVWGGEPPHSAERTLKSYVTRLRRALDAGRDAIEFRAPGYALTIVEQVDSHHFDAELDDALVLLRTADHQQAAARLDTAVARWRGAAYAGFAEEDWARPEAVRLEERLIEAKAARIDALLATGADEQAVAAAIALTEAEPLRERPRALLMTALYASGRQADALRQFQSYADLLAEETGLSPSRELSDLEGLIVRGELGSSSTTTMLRGYRLGERIGEGAFSVVHSGVQPGIDREVAIKIIRGEIADHPEFIRRFEFEARTVARLEHPHIVPLYDFWREPGAGYLVMRLMRGGTAERALRQGGPYSTARMVSLLDDVGGALTTAHRLGIVHRDVRPANLLLDEDGATYLADFGIALAVTDHDGSAVLQPAYAAPEVLRGQPLTPAADVLSLGVTVFELLTGRLPFVDSNDRAELIRRQLGEPLPPVRSTRPELPAAIDEVLARATAKAPEDRYQSVAAMASDLTDALTSGHLGRRPPLRPTAARAVVVPNPYVGLHAFDESDADRFAGREALTASIVATIEQHQLVVVVGPSGSGKSSVVRAGVIPALRRGAIAGSEEWFVATMVPGADPVAALETALLRIAVNPPSTLREQLTQPGGLLRAIRRVLPTDHARLLLFVDQFEELFTQTADEAERRAFLDELAVAVSATDSPLRVVATLRADHFDAPLRHAALAPLVTAGAVGVTPMTPDELERAITRPARSVGVEVELGLVATLVAEMASNPAALPLLQFALTEAFDRRAGDIVLQSSYEEAGGLTGALAARAERIIEQSGAADADVRRIFARLVTIGDDAADTRRRARRSEFGTDERVGWVLDALIAARLLASDADEATREPTVEVAHEALLGSWPRLRRWIDDDRSDLVVLNSVSRSASDWEDSSRDDGHLARGGRLATVIDLAARRDEWLNASERAWIDASVEVDEAERSERSRQDALIRRQNRRLRRALVVAGCLLVAAALGVVGALVLRNRAIASERDAEVERLVALSASEIATNPDRAILLALAAHREREDASTIGAVQRAIGEESRLIAHRTPTLGSSARTTIAAGGTIALEHAVRVDRTEFAFVDIDDDRAVGSATLDARADIVAVSGDGSMAVALVLDDGSVHVVRPDGTTSVAAKVERPGTAIVDGQGERVVVLDLPLSPAGDDPGSTLVIDLASGSILSERPGNGDPSVYEELIGVSADGDMYAISTFGNIAAGGPTTITIVDAATGEEIATHPGSHGETLAIGWSPDGGYALGNQDGSVEVFDAEHRAVHTLFGHTSSIQSVAIGPRGVVGAAGTDGTLRMWRPWGEPLGAALELNREVTSLGASDDGSFQVGFGDGRRSTVDPDARALVDLVRDVEFSAVDARSPNYDQPRLETVGSDVIAAGGIIRRLADDELVLEIDYLPDLPAGLARPPFVSRDGGWMLALDADERNPVGLVFDVTGEHRIPFDFADLAAQDGTSLSDPGSVRVGAGGERLLILAYTTGGQARISAFSLPSVDLVAGPLDLTGGGGTILELASGDVVVSGGLPDGTSSGQGPVRIVNSDLTEVTDVPGSDGLVAHHESADGIVLLGDNEGRVALLDTRSLDVRFLRDVAGPVAAGAISPDGRTAAIVLTESGVQLVDTDSGALIGVPMPGVPFTRNGWPSVSWSDDSRHVWAGPTGPLHRFMATPTAWIDRACEIAGRELTDDEWRRYVGEGEAPELCSARTG